MVDNAYTIVAILQGIFACACACDFAFLCFMTRCRRYNVEMGQERVICGFFSFYVVKDTQPNNVDVLLSISDFCSIRGASSQLLMRTFANCWSSSGMIGSFFALWDDEFEDSVSDLRTAAVINIIGLIGAFVLGNFDSNSQVKRPPWRAPFDATMHMLGAFVTIGCCPLALLYATGWSTGAWILAVIGWGSFGLYIVVRALAYCGLLPTEGLLGSGGDEMSEKTETSSCWPFGKRTAYRERWSCFYLFIEGVAVLSAGIASLLVMADFSNE